MEDADAEVLTREAALLEGAVRQAGALALSLFRTELKKWIKGASSPVSEADIAVIVLDLHTSSVEGSIGAIPRRLMVADSDHFRASAALRAAEAELG